MVPFILALMAVVWDVREQLAFRTDIARQIHVAAAAAADSPESAGTPADPQPIAQSMAQLRALMESRSVSGSITAAVVTRGTVRSDGTACPDGEWCPPRATVRWPATATEGQWSASGTGCASAGTNDLPAVGQHFAADKAILPHEGKAGNESAWISRNLGATEWWVVVDACVEPRPGTFSGRLANLPLRLFEDSVVLRRRIAWGSIHELALCAWCGA